MTTSFYRVTQRSVGQRTLANLQNNLSRLGTLQQQLSSGKQISKPSDSPTGTVSSMQFRSEISTNEQWSRNAQDGMSWLGTADTTLTAALDSVRRVRDLTVQGLNAGAAGPDAQAALATEVGALRGSLIGQANTTYLGRPIFGGVTAGSQAYDSSGAFVGNTSGINRAVGAGSPVRVDANGPEAFGSGTDSLFSVVADINTHLTSGDSTALANDLNRLDVATKNLTGALAGIGARYNQVEQSAQAATDRATSLKSGLSDVEDIDLPKTIVDLQLQQTAYQAALGATAKIIQPSLTDFLR